MYCLRAEAVEVVGNSDDVEMSDKPTESPAIFKRNHQLETAAEETNEEIIEEMVVTSGTDVIEEQVIEFTEVLHSRTTGGPKVIIKKGTKTLPADSLKVLSCDVLCCYFRGFELLYLLSILLYLKGVLIGFRWK